MLPAVEADGPALRRQVRQLLAHLETLKSPLPEAATKAVRAALTNDDPKELQRLLDEHCLVGVQVNPESRVKAARGDLRPALVRDRPALLLVKVHNLAGVTHRLRVESEQSGKKGWLDVEVVNDKPFAGRLSGEAVEYRLLRLTPRQAGKREATLTFDVGAGTQDLGFRAEVPILFTVAPRR